jgi:GTP cyclohydrolase FolE2
VRSEDVAVVAAEVYEVLKLENEAHGDIVINARKNYNNEMLAEDCLRKANRMEVHTPSGDTFSARARLEISYARQVYKALPTRNSYLLLG